MLSPCRDGALPVPRKERLREGKNDISPWSKSGHQILVKRGPDSRFVVEANTKSR